MLEFNYYVPQVDLNEPNTSIYQVDKDINIQNMAKLKENWKIQPTINVIGEKIPIHKQNHIKRKISKYTKLISKLYSYILMRLF